ncbi:DUF4342 domain-containing protein [Aerosakkonemataceae cyanobacterium BLCC-F154]|uniref:DUF4342 domain-containing protein n=1 Tax=Floridaenema fluviatile BLCC-F154 TaxID=3153640 RepID=A0ABV4YGQ7_9CYAN
MNAQFEQVEDQAPTVIVESNTVKETETAAETQEKVRVEEVKFNRETVTDFYKNVVGRTENRYLVVKNKQGRVLTEIPLLVGVPSLIVGTVVFPFAAAVVAVAATVTNLTVAIERKQ